MRIAVIADTHDRLPAHVCAAIAGADEIWHLGDVCMPALLDSVAQLGPPVKVVRGNCDDCPDWPLALDFEREGFSIVLTHIPPHLPPRGAALLLHGHTHVPRNELVGGTRVLNPGCITRPNRGAPASYGWLELRRGESPQWSLDRV
jgi:putative phosphoesterase